MKKDTFVELPQTCLIFGDPVDTPFGTLRWLSFREFMAYEQYLSRIPLNVLHLYHALKKNINPRDKKALKEHEAFKEAELHELVMLFPELQQAYIQILLLMLSENEFMKDSDATLQILNDIFSNKDMFHLMRNHIMTMNVLQEEKVSSHDIVQQAFERDREFRAMKNKDAPTNVDIVSAVGVSLKMLPQEVSMLTPYQMHTYYARIAAIKDYDREILFSTVSSDREIESWAKKIDLFNIKDTSVIEKKDFDNKFGKMFGK